jgi:hypothetical protein
MARVAAARSDAFVQTAGKSCDASLVSSIFVNGPTGIGVKHLHIHVKPPAGIVIRDEEDFYSHMSRDLAGALGHGR